MTLAGMGITHFPWVGDLINAVVPRDLAPLFGHTPLFEGETKKVSPVHSV